MEVLDLLGARRAAGTLSLPGSKSISNRTLLLAALSRGTTEVRSLLEADDTRVMRDALAVLGVRITPRAGSLRIEGVGAAAGFPVKRAELFLGNAGTALRPLTAVLALADGHYRLSGTKRMHERPIGDLVSALAQAGADIVWKGEPGFPPIEIAPRAARCADSLRVRGDVSSQFLSALLIALPWAGGGVRVEVDGDLISKPYVALTLGLIEHFGVRIGREGWSAFMVPAGARYVSPQTVHVEGDASSASYFLAAGVLGGGPVRVEGVGASSLQGDVAFAQVLREMGAHVELGETWIEASGSPPLEPFDLDMNAIPDAAMTAAVLALFAKGPCRLRGIASWRVKETDRIAAMATELRKLGASVEEGCDFLSVSPPRWPATQVAIDTYDDHRMAMAFSLASFGPAPVRINDPGCVSKTFPSYFDEFRKIVS